MYTRFLLPVGILAGTIIGAGMFSLPFVFSRAGILAGMCVLVLAAAVYAVLHLMYADICMRGGGAHQFVGYARNYLGNIGKAAAIAISVIQMALVLTIYLVLAGSFVELIVPGGGLAGVITFWLVGSLAIFIKLERIAVIETAGLAAIIGIVGVIFIKGVGAMRMSSLIPVGAPQWSSSVLLFAPLLFSLAGRVAVPSVVSLIRRAAPAGSESRSIRRAVIAGTFLPAAVYALFVIGTLGITPSPSEDAVSGFIHVLSPALRVAVGVLGLIAVGTSYIMAGLDVANILAVDLKTRLFLRRLFVVGVPLMLYAVASQNFQNLVALTGGIFLALEGLLIMLMWRTAVRVGPQGERVLNRVHPAVLFIVAAVFAFAFLHEVIARFL